jgi:hypothetical protein
MRPMIAVIVVSLLSVLPVGCLGNRPPREPAASHSRAQLQVQPTPREASDEERQLYAQREKQANELERFKGGDAGVVTLVVVVLLVVLLLIVLKVI